MSRETEWFRCISTDGFDGTTRRRFLKAAAATGVLGGVSSTGVAKQSGIRLRGRKDGWRAREPESIKGETNPTLEFEAGQTYSIRWVNHDGEPHNIALVDESGEVLKRTEVIEEKDATQTLTFTAAPEMAEYICEVHPNSMRGTISVTGTSDGGGTGGQIHPVFGFSALSPDTEPPVEPDHEVKLLIREREDIPIPEFYFEPVGLYVEPGDTVKFTFETPHHTVSAFHSDAGRTQRVPEGAKPYSSPVLGAGAYWLYTFEEEGVYDSYCAPHESFGMVMRIVAGSPSGPGAQPVADSPEGEELPPLLVGALVLDDPAIAPDTIVSAGSVSWDEIAPENRNPPENVLEQFGI